MCGRAFRYKQESHIKANFTNELGVDQTVRYLKNVMGLWVFNEAVCTWRQQDLDLDYTELQRDRKSVV